MQRLTGTSVPRVEDGRILTGRGTYIDDRRAPGTLHAAFVRSPFPHARLGAIDVSEARALAGVVAVYTAADLAEVARPLQLQGGPETLAKPGYRCLATDKVRLVGDPVALVIAESRHVAEDACELVTVDYEELPGVGSIDRALSPGAPTVWDDLPGGNLAWENHIRHGDPDAAFARADRVVRETFVQSRQTNAPMETRGCVVTFDPGPRQLTFQGAVQGTHMIRFNLAMLLGLPSTNVVVVNGDIGGSFGQKTGLRHEELAVAAAAMALRDGRPIKWIEDRGENLSVAGQARDERMTVEAAVADDGRILGLRLEMTMDQGAYPSAFLPMAAVMNLVGVMFPGAYNIRDYEMTMRLTFSNKGIYVAYRGPWEIETWARERMLDRVAAELGLDPIEVRRRNLYDDDEFPLKMAAGPTLSGITLRQAIDQAEVTADWAGFRARQAAARDEGRHLGLGVATFIEAAPGPPDYGPSMGFPFPTERTTARLEPDGTVTVFTSQAPHGQGHETTLTQVAADELGVPMAAVRVVHGDSRTAPFSTLGTGGSRAATMASGSVIGVSRELRRQIAEVVAHVFEANPADVVIEDGTAQVAGSPDKALPLAQVGMMAWMAPSMLPPGMSQGIEATYDFASGDGGWTQSVHTCMVEVSLETGQVDILRYVVVEDCGEVINPGIVEGQICGGIAQGIAGVLYEHSAYDDDGTFRAGTFMDYLLPTSAEIPPIEIHHIPTITTQEINFRGVGEGGAMGAPAAVTSAIEDALRPFGVKVVDQYLPPSRILELAGVIPT
jgi:aerobic carbon-monoxide dehydrogenase large subunit